jgi:surface polysaccharide O-acyltransferase-like enzyme
MILDNKGITGKDWERLYTELLYGTPWHHLWFMYAIIGIYIQAPLIRIFTKYAERKHYIYFLLLYLIFGSVIPRIDEIYSIHINFGISDLYSYTGYFIAGYFFGKYDLKPIEKKILYAAGLAAFLWTVFSSAYTALTVGSPVTHYFGNTYPNNMIMAYCIFVLTKNIFNNNPDLLKYSNNKYITSMAGCGLGIYLIHDFFNIALRLLKIDTSLFPAILSAPILALVVYASSYLTILFIKKIPFLNKWII